MVFEDKVALSGETMLSSVALSGPKTVERTSDLDSGDDGLVKWVRVSN